VSWASSCVLPPFSQSSTTPGDSQDVGPIGRKAHKGGFQLATELFVLAYYYAGGNAMWKKVADLSHVHGRPGREEGHLLLLSR